MNTMYEIPEDRKGTTYKIRADISIREFDKYRNVIDFSPQEYQRYFRAGIEWQENLMCSFFASNEVDPVLIPEIALRYHERKEGIFIEVMDGCQRMNTIKNFISGYISLPDHPSVTDFELNSNVYNLSGMTYSQIRSKYPAVAEYLLDMTVHCQIYVNISDIHAAYIFVNVLNNSTALTAQEKRNAIRSFLAKFVRETARGVKKSNSTSLIKPHSLFEVGSDGTLKHVNISHKDMDVDKMIAELISMMAHGPSKGTGSAQINKLYRDESYLEKLPYAKSVLRVLSEALSGIDRNPNLKKTLTVKVLRNYLYILILMSKQNYKVQPDKFMRLYVKAHSNLSTKTKEHIKMGLTHSPYGHHMRGSNGKDTSKSIDMVMEKIIELGEGDEWVETDSKRLYTKEEIQIMAVNQNGKCGRCGYDLGDNPVGSHGYSWRDGGLTITGEGYAAHKYCNLEEGRGTVAKIA